MTGSPVTQSPLDLYTQLKFLDPYISGHSSYYSFRNHYAEIMHMPAGPRTYPKIVGYKNLDQLQGLLGKHGYRITKKECLKLPEKMYTTRYVEMTPEQQQTYTKMKKQAFALLISPGPLAGIPSQTYRTFRYQIKCP